MMTRRLVLAGGAIGLAATAASSWWAAGPLADDAPAEGTFTVTHPDAEWRSVLTPDQYAVLRHSATERPFTSALLHEARRGNFACMGCDLDLFASSTKFDSGTGWPSFWEPLDGAVGGARDCSSGYRAPQCIAAAAAAISAMCSTTVRNRRACATASTASRCASSRSWPEAHLSPRIGDRT